MHASAIKKRLPKKSVEEPKKEKVAIQDSLAESLEQVTGQMLDPKTRRRNKMIANSQNRRNDWLMQVEHNHEFTNGKCKQLL